MSIDDALEIVAGEYGVGVGELTSRKRDAVTAEARKMAMFVLSYMEGVSIMEVAYVMGGMTPGGVAYGIEKVYDMLDFDRATKEHYENIKAKLA